MMEALRIAGSSLGVVMMVMLALMSVLLAMRAWSQRSVASRIPEQALDKARPEGELIAVLAAAAQATLGAPVRIHHVHLHRESHHRTWARAGRMDIMVSHRVGPSR